MRSAAQDLGKQGKKHKLKGEFLIQFESLGHVARMEGKGLKV